MCGIETRKHFPFLAQKSRYSLWPSKLFYLHDRSPGYVGEQEDEQELLTGVRDPFDIIKPEDVVDGEPVNEREFWRNVRETEFLLFFHFSID
jgi:hypothetical protein